MGKLLRFPERDHRFAPATLRRGADRAANSAIILAVTPAARARLVRKIASHHSDGIQSRCHHFETAVALDPMSDAIPARDGPHSPMIERNDVIGGAKAPRRERTVRRDLILSLTDSELGQFGRTHKAMMPAESAAPFSQDGEMSNLTKRDYKDEFMARVKLARVSAGFSQDQMGEFLGLGRGTFKHFETRSYLPHDLIPRFCLLCRVDPSWLFTGKGRMAVLPDVEPGQRVGRPRLKRPKVA